MSQCLGFLGRCSGLIHVCMCSEILKRPYKVYWRAGKVSEILSGVNNGNGSYMLYVYNLVCDTSH